MKAKIILFSSLIFIFFLIDNTFAQTVTGTPSNNGCQNSGIITSTSMGLTTPQYQLLNAGTVISPVPGDVTQFTNNPVFTGLNPGTYVVSGRSAAGGNVFSSGNIIVTDGYVSLKVTTPTKVANCVGATAMLTTAITGGKAPFTYTIATQSAPTVILQNSSTITARTFTFNGLFANNYIVSVTDACGQAITGATSISNPTVTLNDIKLGGVAYPQYSPEYTCIAPIGIGNELFRYTANNNLLSASDAANFTWKIKYQGQLYGKDVDADGYSDLGGDGYSPLLTQITLPKITTRAGVEADMANMRVVLIDGCGATKEFPVTRSPSYAQMYNCSGNGYVRLRTTRLMCFPLTVTFTNIANPADIRIEDMNKTIQVFTGFTAGATYHVTYVDDAGYTTGNFNLQPSQNITIPAVSAVTIAQYIPANVMNLNVLEYGRFQIGVFPSLVGDIINYTVTASNNPKIPVGYTNSSTLDDAGYVSLPKVNSTDPTGYWPKGNYTLSVTTPCGTKSMNATVPGYKASLSGNTITPVCGGFNYVMNGTFDVVSAYQVIVVSGPSNVGQVRDLASSTASIPFNGLSYGTYVFGLRIKGGTQNVLTQTITYNANNAIIVDKINTGGYVCNAGASDAILTIMATSNSPAPGNSLEYSLSTNGGVSYGAYQSGNTFSGLTDATYFFRIKDGCGNIITQSIQIGVAASPNATADGLTSPATICDSNTGSLQLDVDILGAISYKWSGPGINASNEGIKDPLINYSDLSVGNNNLTCIITLGAPCNTSTSANLVLIVNPRPTLNIINPVPVCEPATVDITTGTTTAGSDVGLIYSYFSDDMATIPVADPASINSSDTYYIKGTNLNGCSVISPVEVTINSLPNAIISYSGSTFCQTGVTVVEQLETSGGIYSSDPGLSIDAATGEINLALSSVGNHIILYSFSDGTCTNTTSAMINIAALPSATISYSSTSYCNRGITSVIQTGTVGGTFSAEAGLIIDSLTGEIDLATSTPGTYIITYDFDNGVCSNSTTTTITINATTFPSTLTDIYSECSATAIPPTLTDACAGTITGTTVTAMPITVQGTTNVMWTFDYGNGYTATANQNVIIDDTTAPVIPILADVTGECSATPTVPTTTDNCAGTITGTTTSTFPITTQGTTVVEWTFDDGNGNTVTANQNVIIDDVTAPIIPVLADVTGECSATPTAPTTTDNCAGTITGTTTTVFPITTQGTTVVTWSFDDGNGNVSTANQNVIITDTTAPVVPVLADITAECTATPTAPTAVDACSGTITGTTTAIFPITTQGTTTITWSFDDRNGNISTADQNVVLTDTTVPVAPVLTDITGECSATPTAPTAVDACSGTITGTTTAVFPITTQGTTTITWSFDDGNGNVSTADQNIVLKDTTAPVAPILADITGQCSVIPNVPTALDTCSGTISGTTTSIFPITTVGTTVVTWTFNDGNGNSVTANQNVIISTVTLAGTESTMCAVDGSGYILTFTVNGNAPFTASGTGAPGTWSGNTWTSDPITSGANYNVNVQDANACNTVTVSGTGIICCAFDVTCPTFNATTVSCYDELPTTSNLTIAEFESLGNKDGNIGNNPCGVIVITASNGANSGCNATVTRTYTITEYDDPNKNNIRDAGENIILNSAVCTQSILVSDTTAPVFAETLPAAIVNADCKTIPPAATLTATDNCSNAIVNYSETRVDGECTSKYSLVRTWIAEDDCGNQSTFTQTVNVSCIMNVYNALSPNADGKNDLFKIEGIDCFPNNTVKIYNRYGVVVYEKNSYDNVTNPFEGFSDGRATVLRKDKLPTGTYFYTLEYDDNGRQVNKSGYLYINN